MSSPTLVNGLERAPSVSTGAKPALVLGISLEDYFQVGAFRSLIDHDQWGRFESRLERATAATLDLLDEHGATATFFTLGWVAEHQPELVRQISERGHEIANSGFSHKGVKELDEVSLRDELQRGHEAIVRATGLAPLGVRIPDFVRESQFWALDVVAGLGYAYDASFRPMGFDARREPARRFPFRHVSGSRVLQVLPVPSMRVGPMLLPIGGGNWWRQLPEAMVARGVADWSRASGHPFAMYFQVWELDPGQPRITAASTIASLRHYRNLDRMGRLVREQLSRSACQSYAAHLQLAPRAQEAPRTSATPLSIRAVAPRPGTRTPVTVVVPCFNEADTLPYLQNTLTSVERELTTRYALTWVFVDDGSTDATWSVMQSTFGNRPNCQLIKHEANAGIAQAILTGLRAAPDEMVCSIDADCTYDPHQLALLLPLLEAGVDLVTASPYHPDGVVKRVPGWRLVLSRTLSRMYSVRTGTRMHTWTSCFRGYRRSHFASMALDHRGFLGIAEMAIRAQLNGARVAEVPATLEVRLLGQSKLKVARVILGHVGLLRTLPRWRNAQDKRPAAAESPRPPVSP